MTQETSVAPFDTLPIAIESAQASHRKRITQDDCSELVRSTESFQLDAEVVSSAIRGCRIRQESMSCCCGAPCAGDDATIPATGPCKLLEVSPRLDTLSRTERIVLSQLATGLRVAEIAKNLSRSPKTVSTQKASIMRKLGAETDFELYGKISQLGQRRAHSFE